MLAADLFGYMAGPFVLEAHEWPALTSLTEQAAAGDSSEEVLEAETEVLMHCMHFMTRLREPPASPRGSFKLAQHKSLLACTVHPCCIMTVFASEIGVQLASSEWQIRAQDKLLKAGSPWEGHWWFVRAPFDAEIWMMHADHGVASVLRQSSSGVEY